MIVIALQAYAAERHIDSSATLGNIFKRAVDAPDFRIFSSECTISAYLIFFPLRQFKKASGPLQKKKKYSHTEKNM